MAARATESGVLEFRHTTPLGKIVRHLEDLTPMEQWAVQKRLLDWLRSKCRIGNKDPERPVRILP